MERHHSDAEPGFNHAHEKIRVGGFDLALGHQTQLLKCLGHMLPTGGTAFVHDKRIADDVGKTYAPLVSERMSRWSDQAPVHREKMAIDKLRRRFIGRCHPE